MATTLKVFLGSLLSGVAEARMIGDAQTAQIADAYQKDKLLRYFPVGRVEIKEIVFEVKLAVLDVVENETMVESTTSALQEYRPETLTQLKLCANLQNYVIQSAENTDLVLIPTQ